MLFSDVVGQNNIKQRLCQEVQANRVPHALMLSGQIGSGTLPLALAYARYLLCEHPQGGEPCGVCTACKLTAQFTHPDLHFSFPVVKEKKPEDAISDTFVDRWRQQMLKNPYIHFSDWLELLEAGNQQAIIYDAESAAIQRKLMMKSRMGGRKVLLMVWPELLHLSCANKLLKLIEEPPAGTVILLVSEQPDKLLPTILSRTQRIAVPPLSAHDLEQALQERQGVSAAQASELAHLAHGNYATALQLWTQGGDNDLFFDLFVRLMRLSYARRIKDMKAWSEEVATLGRERQKALLAYCQRLIRENFVFNFQRPELNYLTEKERHFSTNFARFVNERNVIPIMNELSLAERDIEQNVNPKMVFFDFALKMIVLLIQ